MLAERYRAVLFVGEDARAEILARFRVGLQR
jgi:hypothetical protein